MVNSFLALLLWIPPFGWLGLHHFYLGRHLHGLLWATSCGGYVIGWLRDLFCLESYCEIANSRQKGEERKPENYPRPPYTIAHFFGQAFLAGRWLRYSLGLPIPELLEYLMKVLAACCVVWAVRSEARRACYLPQVLKFGLGAAAVEVLLGRLGVLSGFDLPLWAAMYASYATTTWRSDSAEGAISGRTAAAILVVWLVWCAQWGRSVTSAGDDDGEPGAGWGMRFRFGNSNTWSGFNSAYGMFEEGEAGEEGFNSRTGWQHRFKRLGDKWKERITLRRGGMGEREALRTLGLDPREELSRSTITKAHRRLSLEHHPDKNAAACADDEGSCDMQTRLNEARDVLMAQAK